MKRFLHIVLVLLVAAACQGPRVIPKDTLTDIYTDMFLADQMVRDDNVPRVRMDTLLLYEAVFEKYGYDTDDYLYSLRHYLKDPEHFVKVFENVAKRLEGEVDALKKIIEHENWVANMMGAKRPQLDSILEPFSKKAVYLGLARVARDTSRYPAWFRLEAVHEDTLMVSVDSLAALQAKDTLPAKAVLDKPVPASPLPKPLKQVGDRPPRVPRPGIIAAEEVANEEVAAE